MVCLLDTLNLVKYIHFKIPRNTPVMIEHTLEACLIFFFFFFRNGTCFRRRPTFPNPSPTFSSTNLKLWTVECTEGETRS